MNKNQIEFYQSFYGSDFHRHFRRPTEQINQQKIRTQVIVKNPIAITLHVKRSNGLYPSYCHVYNQNNRTKFIDRAFFDFDISHPEAKEIISQLQDLRRHGIKYEIKKQLKLIIDLNELIIDDKIAKPAIDESIKFAKLFQKSFGKLPFLLFSGCKGAHVYTFFKPQNYSNFNDTITWFAERVKITYNFETMDLAVNKDALSRLSRVPYSKHQYTHLTVVPFDIDDSYDAIMEKSMHPFFEPLNVDDYRTEFNLFLQKADEKLLKFQKRLNKQKISKKGIHKKNPKYSYKKVLNIRKLVKDIIGQPMREYNNYDIYNCPFHEPDNNPSFAVYEKNYHCFGCGKHGNYWKFLKDYYEWNNDEVMNYLKKDRR